MTTPTKEVLLIGWLETMMGQRRLLRSHLAKAIGVSHPTVLRWLNGEDVPSAKSCGKLAELTGVPVSRILALAGHTKAYRAPDLLPDFREYMSIKYPEVHEDIIGMVARAIEVG